MQGRVPYGLEPLGPGDDSRRSKATYSTGPGACLQPGTRLIPASGIGIRACPHPAGDTGRAMDWRILPLALGLLVFVLPSAATAAIEEFAVPTASSSPLAIAAGSDGALWFTENTADQVGRVTTTGGFTELAPPTAFSSPAGIAPGPDGALWFTEQTTSRIGRVTTGGSFTEYPIPTPDSLPADIAAGPDGALWFTDRHHQQDRTDLDRMGGDRVPCPHARRLSQRYRRRPGRRALVHRVAGNKVGRMTTGGAVTEFAIPDTRQRPDRHRRRPGRRALVRGSNAGKIGRVTTAGAVTEFTIPSPGSRPSASPRARMARCGSPKRGRTRSGGSRRRAASPQFPIPTPNSDPTAS